MTRSEVIDGQLDPHLIQLPEQGEGIRIHYQQLTFGQLQHQHYLAGGKLRQKSATLLQQSQVATVGRADIETDVKAIGQACLLPAQHLGHLLHDQGRHGHYQPGLLRLGNKEVGTDKT